MTETISFLHIGKTGGTAVRTPIRDFLETGPDVVIELPMHRYGLKDVMEDSDTTKVMFFIREPVSRFASGFNSRLRKGWPRHQGTWSKKEEEAFATFKTPNELAEGLGANGWMMRHKARKAVQAIRHTRMAYEHYLGSVELLEQARDRIFFVGAQETLDADYEMMKKLLGMGPEYVLPRDDVGAHRTPDGFSKDISPEGRANLEKYFAKDFEIYEWCRAYREKMMQDLEMRLGAPVPTDNNSNP